MIDVSLSLLISLIASLGAVSVVLAWLASVLQTRSREGRTRRGVICCRVCSVSYEWSGDLEISNCPACGTPNETREQEVI
jgi:uncharacterized paraquat-inducible protein A